ncbi:2-oxo acid dehydrogenase subunit E2 [Achromobacter sp. JD417]|uniref:dihydrolipoamide acetyltransferase family protein n=1 Tax=Achromobacter sp. JD417 TaxID=2893881 RepID=UPI0035A68B08
MGIHIIKMPDIGEGIAEVELVGWHVKVGDTVAEDQPLADVMTDKATVEIPSPVVGKVISLGGDVGQVMAVGGELIRLEVEGEGNVKAGAAAAAAPAGKAAVPAAGGIAADGAQRAGGPSLVESGVAASTPGVSTPGASTPGASTPGASAPATSPPAKSSSSASTSASASGPASAPAKSPAARQSGGAPAAVRQPGEKPLASPAVRKRAWDLGVELRYVQGSGPAGRILHEDLDAWLQGQGAASSARGGSAYVERNDEDAVPVIGLRRKIAQKMAESKRRIPHFSYVEEIDVTELEDLRVQLNAKWGESRGKLTLLPLLARAMVVALRDFPQINARYDDEAGVVTRYGAVHIGIATQSDGGLMVPVMRHAEARDLWSMAAEINRLAQAVRSGSAGRDELSGSTITITSLGPLGGIVTTPVINHPEVGIVGVNRIVERPAFRNGTVVARKLMNLSSSFDHRVVDGMDAARFIQAVRALLEQPALLFVE